MALPIDLRSDTVTRPTPGMREAMMRATDEDDVIGRDPTCIALEEKAAELLGKEAALFVPSGTMANQICIKVHTRPGQEVFCAAKAHIVTTELSMMAALSGVQPHPLPAPQGWFTAADLESEWPTEEFWVAPVGLVEVENTMNAAGGRVFPQPILEEVCHFAHARGVPVHLDGARIFNAAVASGRSAAEIAAPVDSVAFCLSKGLGAPVGSLVLGTASFIQEARRVRQMMGGGMRQVGFLCAAGLYALDHHIERLAEDHANARFLAEELAHIDGLRLDLERVETNMVYFDPRGTGLSTEEFIRRLWDRGVLTLGGRDHIRLVTHLGVTRQDVARAVDLIAEVARGR